MTLNQSVQKAPTVMKLQNDDYGYSVPALNYV